MASGYPLLPGFAPTQQLKEQYRKVSAQKQQFNRDVKNIQPTKYPLPRQPKHLDNMSNTLNNRNNNYISTTHDYFNAKNVLKDTSQLYQPDWVRLDRHVLRFFAFFKESVVQSNMENYRNRKVKILFYLEDNSIAINEQKSQNSGIPQGRFLKRQKCIKDNGSFITAYDFNIGQPIMIHGRQFYLYNCDEYTRQFYEKLGNPQGESERYDDDQWSKTMNTKWVPKKDAMMKQYLQKKLGGGKVNSAKQFLENDRKVLKFYANSAGYKFLIHYFLADDTIEVREVNLPNSGKDPFPVTFKRQKLPFQFALNQPGQTYAENFLRPQQLKVGSNLNVFGTIYHLEGCDQFTQHYYATKLNIQFPQFHPKDQYGIGHERSHIIIPPHNGIGSQEDSLGYIYKLIPKPPKKDFFKWVDQQISLRFTAFFDKPKPQDTNRKFIITYYLNDDSLQIYEIPSKNSGFSQGKFLQRKQYKNQYNQVVKPQNIIIGQDVKINGYWFHVTDCDDFTKKWYAQNTIWEKVLIENQPVSQP